MLNPRVSIVIPNYGRDLLEKNLTSIVKASELKENRIEEIIIVDDASPDDSVSYIKKNFPSVKIIKHKKNRGFSSTLNTGARTARMELIAMINNDVSVSVNFLEHVIKHFENDEVFGVSLNERGYSWAKGKFEDGFIVYNSARKDNNLHESFWVSGGSGVVRRDVFMRLGGMDEKLLSPYYWEDIDLSYRAQKRGFVCLWEPKSLIYHNHESSISKVPKRKKQNIQERNQLLFIWKNLTSQRLFKKHLRGLAARTIKHPGYLKIVLLALFKLKLVLKERKKEKKETKVSDEAIFAKFK